MLAVAYFNPTTFALLSVEVDYRGVIDRIVHKEQADGSAVLEMSLESRFRDHQKGGYRVRSDADQRRIDAADDGLRHVTKVVNEQVIFGRMDRRRPRPSTPTMRRKKTSHSCRSCSDNENRGLGNATGRGGRSALRAAVCLR